MDHLTIRQNNSTSNGASLSDVDINAILSEYGIDNIEAESTVLQQNGTIVSSATPSNLIPPSIDDVDEVAEEFNDEESLVTDVDSTSIVTIDFDAVSDVTNSLYNLENREPVTEIENSQSDTSALLPTEEVINLLPKNPSIYEIDESTSRFSGAEWYKAIQESTILLAGVGGIGSNVLYNLARMKPSRIFIYDDDVVETANLSGQMYSYQMVGKAKVNAMAQLAIDFSLYSGVIAIPRKFTIDMPASNVMICGFDNMKARRDFFQSWINNVHNTEHKEECLYIDGRLSLSEFQVFCMRGDDTYNIDRYYKEFLFNDREAESEVCSMKQTTYCSCMIGAVIVNLFTNFVANSLHPVIEKELPFKTYYSAEMMYFKTEA